MVKMIIREVNEERRTLFQCEACGFAYEEKAWAEKCQQYCEEHQACNIEITQHAVPIGQGHWHRSGIRGLKSGRRRRGAFKE
ncbi:MAG: hypothetical protein HYX84_01295 [Chloroflexi bacterium]|nr:hypothetical protein [Chloroflexota bacterium]